MSIFIKDNYEYKQLQMDIGALQSTKDRNQVKQLNDLITQLDSAERQLQLITKQMKVIKSNISLLSEPKKKAYESIFQSIEKCAITCKIELSSIANSTIHVVKQTRSSIINHGKIAMNKIGEITKIQEKLSRLMDSLDKSMTSTTNKIKKVETLSSDFRDTTAQIKNFGRTVIGKAPIIDSKSQGTIASTVLKGLKQVLKLQDNLQKHIVGAFCKIDDLQKEAMTIQKKQEKKPKKSVSSELKMHKENINKTKDLHSPKVMKTSKKIR